MRPKIDWERPYGERPLLLHHLVDAAQIYLPAERLEHVKLLGIMVVLFLVGLELTGKQAPCFLFGVREFAQNICFVFSA